MDVIRRARAKDVDALARLFGTSRDRLAAAFDELMATPQVTLVVAENTEGVIGTAQLTALRGLAWDGAQRGLLEGVRAARRGVTTALLKWAIDESRRRGYRRLHLDSGLARTELREFYARFGFEHAYEGYVVIL